MFYLVTDNIYVTFYLVTDNIWVTFYLVTDNIYVTFYLVTDNIYVTFYLVTDLGLIAPSSGLGSGLHALLACFQRHPDIRLALFPVVLFTPHISFIYII